MPATSLTTARSSPTMAFRDSHFQLLQRQKKNTLYMIGAIIPQWDIGERRISLLFLYIFGFHALFPRHLIRWPHKVGPWSEKAEGGV